MSALLNHARRDIKWGLVIHTVLMFSCATLFNASLYLESISYVDDRGFPGAKGIPPGPVGYQYLIGTDSLTTLCYLIVYLNQWLADGLLVSSVSMSAISVSHMAASSAVSVLYYLCHELLVHRLTMPGVPRLCGYVLGLLNRCGLALTFLAQRWESRSSTKACDRTL